MNSNPLEPTRTGEGMTLDDAIAHADWVADNCEGECSEDHRQLSEWLQELKRLRAENATLCVSDATLARQGDADLKAENAKLRELMSGILAYGYHGGFLCADGVWSCPHFQECFNCPIEEGPEKYVRRGCRWLALARELGIEVE